MIKLQPTGKCCKDKYLVPLLNTGYQGKQEEYIQFTSPALEIISWKTFTTGHSFSTPN